MSLTFMEVHMKAEDLYKIWDTPDFSKLAPKQISIRLPIILSAKISALCEMYPNKTKTQIIVDLLASAIDQLGEALPSEKGAFLYPLPEEALVSSDMMGMADSRSLKCLGAYEDIGPQGRFLRLTKKYLQELEKELGLKDSYKVPDPIMYEAEQ